MSSRTKNILLKYGITLTIGLAVSLLIMWQRGAFSAAAPKECTQYVSDGFCVPGVLLLCFGGLLWASSAGFFDLLSYAVNWALFNLIPFMGNREIGDYISYRNKKEENRKKPQSFILICGLILIAFALIALAVYHYSD